MCSFLRAGRARKINIVERMNAAVYQDPIDPGVNAGRIELMLDACPVDGSLMNYASVRNFSE